MPDTTDANNENEETILAEEDLKKLYGILTAVQASIDKAYEATPADIKQFIESVTIKPLLRENLSDQITLEITFCMKFDSPSFSASMMPRKSFQIDCLSPNIETLVEEKFKETLMSFMLDFCHFLYASADTLHGVLNP